MVQGGGTWTGTKVYKGTRTCCGDTKRKNCGGGGRRVYLFLKMVSICEMNYSAPHGWGGDPSSRDDYTPWSDGTASEDSRRNADGDFDPASITVQMSIWQELCAGHPKENESQVSCETL